MAGSDQLLVQIAFLQRHHPSAEQLDTGAAIHGSLEGLQSIDLSFGLPVAPGLRHSVPHRLQVLAYRLRKTLHRVDPRRARIDQPSVQPLSVPPRSRPRNRIARRRIAVNSADAAFSASTLATCRAVIWPRGLTQSAAAVGGEITRPVIGSSVRTRTGAGSSCSSPSREGSPLRQGARKRAR